MSSFNLHPKNIIIEDCVGVKYSSIQECAKALCCDEDILAEKIAKNDKIMLSRLNYLDLHVYKEENSENYDYKSYEEVKNLRERDLNGFIYKETIKPFESSNVKNFKDGYFVGHSKLEYRDVLFTILGKNTDKLSLIISKFCGSIPRKALFYDLKNNITPYHSTPHFGINHNLFQYVRMMNTENFYNIFENALREELLK